MQEGAGSCVAEPWGSRGPGAKGQVQGPRHCSPEHLPSCDSRLHPLYLPSVPAPPPAPVPPHASTRGLLFNLALTWPGLPDLPAQAHGPGAGNNTWLTYNKQLQYFWLQVYTTKKLRKFPQTLIFILGNQTVTLTAY